MNHPDSPPAAAPPPHPRRRWRWTALAVVTAVVVIGVAGVVAWLRTPAALGWIVERVSVQSQGRLVLTDVRGSLWSIVEAGELRYRDADVELVAHDVALEWSPWALCSRTIRVASIGAQRIVVTLAANGQAATLPASLALPFEIDVKHAAFGEVVVAQADKQYRVHGVRLGYAGGASTHHLRELSLAGEWGTLTSDLSIATEAPFAVAGAAAFAGTESAGNARFNLAVGGTLATLQVKINGTALASAIDGSASVTPFGAVALQELALQGRALDLAALDAALPRTAIDVAITATMGSDGRMQGTLEATNRDAGPLDRERLPLDTLATAFVLSADTLELAGLTAAAGPTARATGSARIPVSDAAARSHWQLRLAAVDLARIHSQLASTHLSGQLRATVTGSEQQVEGDLGQDNLGASFAATVTGDLVDVTRLRARAGKGEFNGRVVYDRSGSQHFEISGKAQRFDPAQFGAFPAAALDGDLRVVGSLQPAWQADVAAVLAPGSRLRGVALKGQLRGHVSAGALRDADIDLTLADATLKARGSWGRIGDRLDAEFRVPEAGSVLRPLGDWVPAAIRNLRGRVDGKGSLAGGAGEHTGTIEVHGENLALDAIKIGTVDVRGEVTAAKPERQITLSVSGTRLSTPAGRYASLSATLAGTTAAHRLQAALAGDGVDADLVAEGALDGGLWKGTLVQLANRGPYAAKLAAPARLELGGGQVVLGETRLAIAGGNARIGGFRWVEGRIESTGSFDGVPLAALAHMAGTPLPLRSTLVLGGQWNIHAAPRLNGSLTLRRERGDLFAGADAAPEAEEIAFGIARADLDVALVDDALAATLVVDATRLGQVRSQFAVEPESSSPSARLGAESPVRGTLTANLSSLRPLQPLLGNTALVDGRLKLELTADGTLRQVAIRGTATAADLRLDAPAYGLHWTDGVVRANLNGSRLALDEFSFRAGDGRFNASGTFAAAVPGDGAAGGAISATDIVWRADKLRVSNRPDLRLIVSGAGKLGFQSGHLSVSGALSTDEGQIDFDRVGGAKLGDDVIIAGRAAKPAAAASRFGKVPLAIDLDLDLGRRLTVTGQGLRAEVAGKVRVTAAPDAPLLAKGVIRAVNGTYFAFGQRLVIDRGRLIFDGPIDNPALDVVALRKNLQVEAGVTVTGTVRVPQIQLTSEPPVPDGEKLSWLVLGQGLDRSTAADTAALQAAAATLFGNGRAPLGTSIAQSVGLDDIAIRGSSGSSSAADSSGGASSQVVAVGKRLSDKLYIVYEQGLSVANNALKIEYALTRSITLRAEAGLISGVGIYYRRSFE